MCARARVCVGVCVCVCVCREPVSLEWVEAGIPSRGCSELRLLYLETNFHFSMAAFQTEVRLRVFSLLN